MAVYRYQAINRNVALHYASEDLGMDIHDLDIIKIKKNFDKMRTETVMIKVDSKTESMIIDFIEHVLDYMGIDFNVDFAIKKEEQKIWLMINADDPALLIGGRGRTLDALQMLTNAYMRRITEQDLRVVLDVNDYRERRVGQIKRIVRQAINDISDGDNSVLLDPMNSFERQLVHQYIGDSKGLTTKSEGERANRCVRIMREAD